MLLVGIGHENSIALAPWMWDEGNENGHLPKALLTD
jgi:hypothetical protein